MKPVDHKQQRQRSIQPNKASVISVVYDGECPICKMSVDAFRLGRDYGRLDLIDARKAKVANHPLMAAIHMRGLDLDKGMVVHAEGRFYHAELAMCFLAQYGDAGHIFTAICKIIFRYRFVAALLYPVLRIVRKIALKCKKVGLIHSL